MDTLPYVSNQLISSIYKTFNTKYLCFYFYFLHSFVTKAK